jgi:endonuclease YncB( thermonuclease family)
MNPALLIVPVLLAASGLTIAATADRGNAYVERVVDGDTVILGDGSRIRLIGIDAPEADQPCGQQATDALRRLVEHRVVTVSDPDSVQDRDKYGRLLRYLDTDVDPSASQLTAGLATARYDSTDGYDPHPRQSSYHALEAVAVKACPTLKRNSRWFRDPDGYLKHIENRRITAEKREKRAEREKERREAQQREAELRESEREAERIEREYENSRPSTEQPDGGYTGPRCYAPGGKTWSPC